MRKAKHSLTKMVGHGSSKQYFVGLYIIILQTSSSETMENVLKLGAITFDISIEDGEESWNAELILYIYQ